MKARLLLFVIFLFMVGYKLAAVFGAHGFPVYDSTPLFWTESALQYRTARRVAVTGVAEAVMKDAQYPEGLDVKNRLTIVMETVCGYLYRLFVPKTVPFHTFLIIVIALYSSVGVIPLYLTVRFLHRSRAALLAAALYAVTPAVYTTVTAPGFELQDFALPLIFFHVYFFVRAYAAEKSRYQYSFMSGAFLFAALTSWHLTQFYFLVLVGFVIICFLFTGFDVKPFSIIVATSILAGLVIPALRTLGFVLSLAMLLAYCVILASTIPVNKLIYQKIVLVCLLVVAGSFSYYISVHILSEYRFIYGLLWDKLRHFGVRPAQTTDLPWETLVMWVSPFTSPSRSVIVSALGTIIISGITGAVLTVRSLLKRSGTRIEGLLAYFAVVFVPLYLLMIRMDAFLVWFFCVLSARLWLDSRKILRYVFLLCVIGNCILLILSARRTAGPDRNHLLGMLMHTRLNVPHDAPFLTSFAYGPSILAYADHPIVLHPKFEGEHNTARIEECEHRLFEDENAFYAFCRTYHAEFFVYQADMLLARGPESMRYRTHTMRVSRQSVAYAFHFRPRTLEHFELVYTNPHYRIYRVLGYGAERHDRKPAYFRVYDEQMFDVTGFGIIGSE